MVRLSITETLDVDLEDEQWVCNRCDTVLGSARDNYKLHLRAAARDPAEVYPPLVEGTVTMSPQADWGMLVEFYCPGCGVLAEAELLPPGHPITHDIELDLEDLKRRHGGAA
jgi:acetone carboxylase, gamma subunit